MVMVIVVLWIGRVVVVVFSGLIFCGNCGDFLIGLRLGVILEIGVFCVLFVFWL